MDTKNNAALFTVHFISKSFFHYRLFVIYHLPAVRQIDLKAVTESSLAWNVATEMK
jgi:hypothetical protein